MIGPLLLLERLYKVGVLQFQATETDSITKQNKNEGGRISWNTLAMPLQERLDATPPWGGFCAFGWQSYKR